MLPAQLGSWVCSTRPSKHFVAAAQKALDRNLMNENMILEGLKKTTGDRTSPGLRDCWVGALPPWPKEGMPVKQE